MPGDDPHHVAVWIVIVTYDAPGDLLERCVDQTLATTDDGVHVVVADTGGRAGRRLTDRLSTASGRLEVVDLGANVGFAAALAAGFERGLVGGAEVLVSLNDDVLVEPGWLEPLLGALGSDPGLGGVQPLLVQLGTDPSEINSAGVEIDRFGAGSDRLRGRPVDEAVDAELAAITGGAAAWSAAFVRDVGMPDPRFFLYYEDVEWCRRGARSGWRFALVAVSRVHHAGSASTHRLAGTLRQLQERNRLWTLAMHGSPRELAAGVGLSLRRLRHAPRRVHARALASGLAGAIPRLARRIAGRSGAGSAAPLSDPPPFVRREVQGVNVLGYHHISSGLGDNARRFADCFRAAGVDVVEIDNDLSPSPRLRPANPVPERLHDTTIAIVTAFEFEGLVARFPQLRADGRRLVGYWMWELTTIPDSHVRAMHALDEIWTGSTFVRDAYDAVAPGAVPVRRVPYQVDRPRADGVLVDAWRRRWGDRFTFLVTFDFLSIPERKNPLAAVRALVDAFQPGEAQLVVKSINGHQRPDALRDVQVAAAGRDDVVLLDEHLDEPDHLALIAAADCLVSPHRSEGFGLQPFMALAVGTPVISTRYGGVLDYLDDSNAVLVDHGMVGVVDGEGIYPAGAPWADIDHDGLVDAMRSVRTDAALRARLIDAGHRTADAWPDDETFGRAYVDLLERAEPRTTELFDRSAPRAVRPAQGRSRRT